jgi:hypothetical protein
MGIIINTDDAVKKMQPGEEITFDSLDFIANWFGELHLQQSEPAVEEEERPPPICTFFAGLEDAVEQGPYALALHLNHYERNVFTTIGRKHDLDTVLRV